MTISDIYQAIAGGGVHTAVWVIATPLVLGGVAMVLRDNGKAELSQKIANFGIVIGLLAVAIEILALIYAVQELEINPLSDVDLLLLLAPLYLLAAGLLIEHLLHPGSQEELRKKIRKAVLMLLILGVVFFVLGKLRLYMVFWTNLMGFFVFLAALVAFFYFVVRKVI